MNLVARHMASFIDFYFYFLGRLRLLGTCELMFSIFSHVVLRDTNSEPGLPVVTLALTVHFQETSENII